MKQEKLPLPQAAIGAALLVISIGADAQHANRDEQSNAQSGGEVALPAIVVTEGAEAAGLLGTRSVVTTDSTGLPAAMTVITSEDLGTLNVSRDISNVFRRVPGVVANSIDQGDTGNGFRMRGFATQGTHGADTAVYVDGVPQNMPSSEAGAGHGPAYLEWLTPEMIDRIDVIKGPISALYGDQNRAGAVRIETGTRGIPSSVGLTLESYGGRRSSLVWSKDFDDISSFLVADIYRSDSYRKGATMERDNLFWKLSTVRAGNLYSLRLNHYRSDFVASGYLDYDRVASGLVARSAAQEGALLGFGSGRRTGLVFNRAPANGEEGLYATAYVEDFERERGATGGGIVHNVGWDDRSIFGGRLSNNFVFGDSAAFQIGADFRRDNGDAIRQRYENYVPTPNYLRNYDLDLITYGVFAQGQYKPVESIKLSAGLRADHFDYQIDNRKLPAASTGYRDTVVTPKLGIAWSVSPRLDLFSNIAQGFRSPSAEQISPGGALGPLGQAGGSVNTGIAPSKVTSLDIGFTAAPTTDWTLSGAVYYTENEDETVTVAPDVFRSVGSTTRKGFELESTLKLTRGLSVYGSFARILQARIDNPAPNSAYLLSVPKDQIKVGAQYQDRMGAGKVTYSADAYLTSGVPYFSGTPLVRREMPTYTRYDLRVTYDIKDMQFSLFAILQPHLISEAAYATAGGLMVSPQPRRHFGISARYFF